VFRIDDDCSSCENNPQSDGHSARPGGGIALDMESGTDIDWKAHLRLALIASACAAIAAVLLAGVLPESVIVLSVIVVATMASWYQLDVASEPATVRGRHQRR
jgi:hypothetical protein